MNLICPLGVVTWNAEENQISHCPEEPISKLGDIWILGNHRVMCGDSTLIDSFDKLCTEQADMIFTDPPYGMSYGGGRAEGSTQKGALVKAHGMIKNDDLRDDALINLVKDYCINKKLILGCGNEFLSRFKKKLSTHSYNYKIYKNILNKEIYDKINKNREGDFFPLHLQ